MKGVHDFLGHIACDFVSNFEIVIPLIANNNVAGVLDIDSPKLARFDDEDRKSLETLAVTLLMMTDFGSL